MVGSLVAGILLGVAEALCSYLVDSGLTLAVAYFLFLIVLLVRPRGLFGTP
jgi:branched-chain amino acid transport system permease protein